MVEVMSRDAGSVTGRNVLNMREEFNKDPREMTPRQLREVYRGAEVPPGEEWRLIQLREMLEERQERLEAGEEGEDIKLLQSFIDIHAEV